MLGDPFCKISFHLSAPPKSTEFFNSFQMETVNKKIVLKVSPHEKTH